MILLAMNCINHLVFSVFKKKKKEEEEVQLQIEDEAV